jgi:outer membrane protein OmpA-like peptidoglycan-associated protein
MLLEDSMIHGRTTRVGRPFVTGLFALLALVLISASAVAQSDSTPKFDVFAGYQYLHPGATVPSAGATPSTVTPFTLPDMDKGVGGAFTYNFTPHVGLESDLGFDRSSVLGGLEFTVSGGPRLIWRTDTAAFFIHALGGLNRVSYGAGLVTHNGVGAVLGGGMDLPIKKAFSWRVFEVDYVVAPHNFANLASPQFSSLQRPTFEGVRLRTGVVIAWGGAEPVAPTAACSVQPSEVLVGEPITATATASNFNPKHTVAYSWSGTGGQVTGKDTTAAIDTTNATPGSYTVTAHITDANAKKGEASCSANYTIKPLPPKNPPTVSLSASPSSLVAGGTVTLTASCTSPDGVPVSVANWTSTAGTVSGSDSSATLNTTGAAPGSITVGATCTDSRGLNGQASAQVAIENPPPPPVNPEIVKLEARLSLHSVYFVTDQPRPTDMKGGLLRSQQKTLVDLATDFKAYLQAKPDAHLILGGHADHRGGEAYNKALSERRVARAKSFLVEQGVPEASIDTKAFGMDQNLTDDDVKGELATNTELTSEEKARVIKNIVTIRMASNRRVDVTLSTTGQTSTRQFPFNATDALTLIGGRTPVKKTPAMTKKPAPKKP